MADDARRIDDAQLLRLLWRGAETPSSRSGLTVGRIVEAAVELAREAGLGAVSMRRVAERLGVGTMSLYTYVPGRAELLLLMSEHVAGELLAAARSRSAPTGWREGLTAMADEHWAHYQRHPWVLDVPLSRPAIGPNQMDRYEHELSLVDGLGLDDVEMHAVVELVGDHVAGAARRQAAIGADRDASGLSDDEWWYSVLPTLTEVLADRNYPLSSRVGEAIGAPHLDTAYLMRFGLERILDGIEHLIRSRQDAT